MKTKEIRNLSAEEQNKKIDEAKKELIKLNAQVSTGQGSKNSGQVKTIKKTIARIKTIQNEK
ncbi:50S ribosomal protein L29 [Candidatus Woesearchaeota archaeon]|nr:MAG: 50S ribosomal protein L29 [Candidatus Woesearchaeota archaeon]